VCALVAQVRTVDPMTDAHPSTNDNHGIPSKKVAALDAALDAVLDAAASGNKADMRHAVARYRKAAKRLSPAQAAIAAAKLTEATEAAAQSLADNDQQAFMDAAADRSRAYAEVYGKTAMVDFVEELAQATDDDPDAEMKLP
jgi:alpha-D-ribose 1-methylphosphonate 5-triphosphate synthase subunit PhnH